MLLRWGSAAFEIRFSFDSPPTDVATLLTGNPAVAFKTLSKVGKLCKVV